MKNPLLPDTPLINTGPAPSLGRLPRTFRLAVWNWHKCKHADWKRDFLNLCAHSDLFLAQEARLSPACAEAVSQSGLNWNAAISFLSPRARIPTGIAAGCRAPATDIVFNASVCEPLLHIPKMTMRLLYPLENTRLLVINLHAINFTGIGPFKRTLQNASDLLARFDGPVIVAGDFNVWSRKRHEELILTAQKLGLREITFAPDLRTRYFRRTVDYIFVRGLEAVESSVPAIDSSDHRPLTAALRLT